MYTDYGLNIMMDFVIKNILLTLHCDIYFHTQLYMGQQMLCYTSVMQMMYT